MNSRILNIFFIALAITVIGIASIYSSTYQKEGELWQVIYRRQLFWAILSAVAFFLMARFNYRRLWDLTYVLYSSALILLFLVFLLGITRLGAQRWISLAWFNFQPTEVVKLIMVIFLARYFSKKTLYSISSDVGRMGLVRAFILPFLFVIVPVGLIVEQPDLGSGLLIFFIFVAMLYLSGVKLRYLLMLGAVCAAALPVFWHFLRGYQKDRLLVFLNPNVDPLGAGYTIIQAKIAIGSGGFWGKGWLSGTQSQLHFLPESHTDFIFSTFAEEWGFIGVGLLLCLYFLLIRQGLLIAEHTRDAFGRLIALGITSIIAIQVMINLAMNMGCAPVVGIPLPLMSYGGSSLLVTFLSLGILANISRNK